MGQLQPSTCEPPHLTTRKQGKLPSPTAGASRAAHGYSSLLYGSKKLVVYSPRAIIQFLHIEYDRGGYVCRIKGLNA
jgi:hypothetical protein